MLSSLEVQEPVKSKDVLSFNPNAESRTRIKGRRCTIGELAKLIADDLKGDPLRKKEPLTPTQIMKKYDIVSSTFYRYESFLVEMGLAKKDEECRYIRPEKSTEQEFKDFSKQHPLLNDPIVKDWFEDMQNRKRGKGIKIRHTLLNRIELICNTLRINPSQLIIDKKTSEEIKGNVLIAFRERRVEAKCSINYNRNIDTFDYELSYALASLGGFYGVIWETNTSTMSRKIVGHANYADVRLIDEELELADKYLEEKFGIDSDVYRIFWVGVESAARANALFSMPLSYNKTVSKNGNITYVMEATETKTEHIKGGKWTKWITRSKTQKSLDLLRDRGSKFIWENPENLRFLDFRKKIRTQLLDLYQHLGKIHNWQELQQNKKEKKLTKTGNYWFDHHVHVLRHVGAHFWLVKTKYNYGFVAKLGGWNTIDECKNSYGEMPPEIMMEVVESINISENQIGVVA